MKVISRISDTLLVIKYIVIGWWNVLLDFISDVKYKKYFNARKEICDRCDKNSCGVCTVCHCVITAKTKVEEMTCPLNYWGTVNDMIKEENTIYE